jgi:acetyl esterase/lipase
MRMLFKTFGLLALTVVLAACSPSLLNMVVPDSGYSVHDGIAYGGDPRQKLDVYVPDGLTKPAPVLLFFYGGSWQRGDRGEYRWLGQTFAAEGMVTVVADYRLYPQAHFPDFVNDAALALVKTHQIASQYGGDASRIFIAGHSAGAYNAVMLASDPQYIRAAGGDLSWIRGVIGIAGPYDFLPMKDPAIVDAFGGPNVAATQPINFIDGARPPMLLVAGIEDQTVSPGNSGRMAAKLRANGSKATDIFYPDVGHIGILLSLAPGFRGKAPLREDMMKFIGEH